MDEQRKVFIYKFLIRPFPNNLRTAFYIQVLIKASSYEEAIEKFDKTLISIANKIVPNELSPTQEKEFLNKFNEYVGDISFLDIWDEELYGDCLININDLLWINSIIVNTLKKMSLVGE